MNKQPSTREVYKRLFQTALATGSTVYYDYDIDENCVLYRDDAVSVVGMLYSTGVVITTEETDAMVYQSPDHRVRIKKSIYNRKLGDIP